MIRKGQARAAGAAAIVDLQSSANQRILDANQEAADKIADAQESAAKQRAEHMAAYSTGSFSLRSLRQAKFPII